MQNTTWTRPGFVPTWVRNALARRRVAISLVGFTTLVSFNVFVKQTIPFSPLEIGNPWVACALPLLVCGLAIRSWSAGTLNKSRELTTTGPYALVRNPLYVGSFLMMFSFCILCRDVPTLLFVAGPMTLLYWIQVQFEESRLSRLFPDQWAGYQQTTPRFIPRRVTRRALGGWSRAEWMRNREYRALAASAGGLLAVYAWHVYGVSRMV